jgi:NTP pyrophosphatase (non-canonical NTP hydrolase)
MSVNLADVRKKNIARALRWHEEDSLWTGADWSNAMGGEAGEAMNVVKKIRRHETGIEGRIASGIPSREELIEMLAAELADTVLYADLLAAYYGIDLGRAVIDKFNLVSAKQGFPERLGIPDEAAPLPGDR